MFKIIKRLWELPPAETVHKITRRISGQHRVFDVQELAGSARQMRSQRFYDFLSRYEAILENAIGWQKFEFEGRHVLEIGCGPVLGFGPIALFRGAASYSAIDPQFDPRVFDEPAIVDTYFLGVFKDLSAIYGHRCKFPEFIDFEYTIGASPILRPPILYGFLLLITFSQILMTSNTLCLFPVDRLVIRFSFSFFINSADLKWAVARSDT